MKLYINDKELPMPKMIKYPSVPVSARKTEVTAKDADDEFAIAEAAREKRADLRKWLKETKRGRNAERAGRRRFDAAKTRYFRALLDFAHAAAVRNRDTGGSFVLATALAEVHETTALAIDAADAKLFGREQYASAKAAKAAKYNAIAAFMAAEAPAYEKINEVFP